MQNTSSPSRSSLRINVTGERLRGLLGIRLREYNRQIERVDRELVAATAEFEQADADTRKRVEDAMAKARLVGARGRNRFGDGESVGFSAVFDAKGQIDKLANIKAGLAHYADQVRWLIESFDGNTMYELSGDDLITLGIGQGSGRNGTIFDALEI